MFYYFSSPYVCYMFRHLGILYLVNLILGGPIPVAARSEELVSGRSLAGKTDRIPPGAWMSVSCECCVCDGPIARPEESYRVWRV